MANEAILLKNEVNIEFRIKPKSPLLIKEGVRENSGGSNEIGWLLKGEGKDKGKPYIPGSTLKGLFREKFTSIYYDYLKVDRERLERAAMYKDILNGYQEEMEKLVNSGKIDGGEIYGESLEVEKLFGSKVLRGRFWAGDAVMEGEYNPEERKMRSITPIDRFTGGAVVPLMFEYVEDDFTFDMKIKNITMEELRLLLFIIRDSQNGEIRVGNSKSRGFGQVELAIDNLYFKDYRGQNREFNMNVFGDVEARGSVKVGDKYLIKNYRLRKEFKDITSKNILVQHIMGGI